MDLTNTLAQRTFERDGCQYIGPDQDPRRDVIKMCGHTVLKGKAYCGEHYNIVYGAGTALTKKRSAAVVAKKQHEWAPGELEDLLWECYEELITEGEIEA